MSDFEYSDILIQNGVFWFLTIFVDEFSNFGIAKFGTEWSTQWLFVPQKWRSDLIIRGNIHIPAYIQ